MIQKNNLHGGRTDPTPQIPPALREALAKASHDDFASQHVLVGDDHTTAQGSVGEVHTATTVKPKVSTTSPLSVSPGDLKRLRNDPVSVAKEVANNVVLSPDTAPSTAVRNGVAHYDAHADGPATESDAHTQDYESTGDTTIADDPGADAPSWVDWLCVGVTVVAAVAAVVVAPELAPLTITLAAHAVTQVAIRKRGGYLTSTSGLCAGLIAGIGVQLVCSGNPLAGATVATTGLVMSDQRVVDSVKSLSKDTLNMLHGTCTLVNFISRHPWFLVIVGVLTAILALKGRITRYFNHFIGRRVDARRVPASATQSKTPTRGRMKSQLPRLAFWRRSSAFVS